MGKIILIVDIETTGMLDEGGKIVEIGIVKLDLESGKITPAYNSLIRENGLDETHKNEPFGWIFRNSDLEFEELLNAPTLESQREEIQKLFDSYYATAYNKEFDFSFLMDRSFRIKQLMCPMRVADPILDMIGGNYDGLFDMLPSVEECYHYFFKDIEYTEKHRGMDDAIHEAHIVYKLYELGKFKINNEKQFQKKLNLRDNKPYSKRELDANESFTPEIYSKLLEQEDYSKKTKMLIPYRKGNKWGFANEHGIIKINCVFDFVEPFNNGLAKVKIGDRFGFIAESGEVKVPIIYLNAGNYSEGKIAVEKKGQFIVLDRDRKLNSVKSRWGFVDSNGDIVIDFKFYKTFDFNCGRAAFVDENKKFDDEDFSFGKVGFIDFLGNIVIEAKYQRRYNEYSSGLLGFCIPKEESELEYAFKNDIICLSDGEKEGMINILGEVVIPFEYNYLMGDFNPYCYFTLSEHFSSINKTGFIDKNNKIVFQKINRERIIGPFCNGFTPYEFRKSYGYLNEDFEVVIDPIYKYAGKFQDGFAKVQEHWGGVGLINKDNEMCFYEPDKTFGSFQEGLCPIKSKNWGFIDKSGTIVIDTIYKDVCSFKKRIAQVKTTNNKIGYIDKNGNEYWED
jgi:DNA polymerase-3 subunit epsilon